MSRKKLTTFCDYYVLPSDNDEMRQFVEKYKSDMMVQVLSSIDFAIKNGLQFVEVFHFKNSNFVITISKNNFKENLDHIYDCSLELENYEMCSKVIKLQNQLNKVLTNEKKKNGGKGGGVADNFGN